LTMTIRDVLPGSAHFSAIKAAKLFTFSKAKMLQQSSPIANHTCR
jgi:hypothetical protein